jgi:ABC-type glutathione transport system ATPase component
VSTIGTLRDRHEIDIELKSSEEIIQTTNIALKEIQPTIDEIERVEKTQAINNDLRLKIDSANSSLQNLINQKSLVAQESKVAEDRLEATIRLKQFSEQAQMESIASVVESINMASKEFLDLLFPDNPISVALLPYKQTKDAGVRAKFSTVIKYKGCEYSDIDEISGGEYDRIVLAYQLALNQIYQSPILLLDEAFTAVEEELFLLAMDALKLIAENKLIVVVSHGAIQGLFDEVIDV